MEKFRNVANATKMLAFAIMFMACSTLHAQLITDGETPPDPGAIPPVTGSGTVGTIPVWTDLRTLGNSVMVEKNGNIGIGTNNPNDKLEVRADWATYRFDEDAFWVNNSVGLPCIRLSRGGHSYLIQHSGQSTELHVIYTGSSNPVARFKYNGTVYFDRILYVPRIIASNVELGESITANDATFNSILSKTLHVSNKINAGEIEVGGKVHARSMQVSLDAGADFVFADDFKLRSISEVEEYVVSHNRLPDVPSAEEMTENGIDVGDFQVLLLQKVEELTLYIIELEKKNMELNSRVSELEDKEKEE